MISGARGSRMTALLGLVALFTATGAVWTVDAAGAPALPGEGEGSKSAEELEDGVTPRERVAGIRPAGLTLAGDSDLAADAGYTSRIFRPPLAS